MKKCCVVGIGYIGLPTAAIIADKGFEVLGVDIDKEKINKLRKGEIYINEPSLEELVKKQFSKGNFKVSCNVEKSDIFIIAVPTPLIKSNSKLQEPNIDYILDAALQISRVIEKNNLVILESTSPIGSTEKIAEIILENTKYSLDDIHFAYCPERVLPGDTLNELIMNDRVIGGLTELSSLKSKSFYKTFCKGEIYITDAKTAEMSKLTENAYRDINIAYANELSMFCDKFSIDVFELINLANKHPRVNILNPGCGVGGHCIPIDPWFIAYADPKNTKLIQTARLVNNNKTTWIIEYIEKKASFIKKNLKREIIIGCFGLSFKPNIDDLRESPALKITKGLIQKGLKVFSCEPNINSYPNIKLYDINELVEKSDLLVFLVAHSEFRNIKTLNKEVINLCGLKLFS